MSSSFCLFAISLKGSSTDYSIELLLAYKYCYEIVLELILESVFDSYTGILTDSYSDCAMMIGDSSICMCGFTIILFFSWLNGGLFSVTMLIIICLSSSLDNTEPLIFLPYEDSAIMVELPILLVCTSLCLFFV